MLYNSILSNHYINITIMSSSLLDSIKNKEWIYAINFIDDIVCINYQDSINKTTPLLYLITQIKYNTHPIDKYLIETLIDDIIDSKLCDYDLQDINGNTVLMHLIQINHESELILKIIQNCNCDVQNNKGMTALMLMINQISYDYDGKNIIINKFMESKMNLQLIKNDGDTALYYSIHRNMSMIMSMSKESTYKLSIFTLQIINKYINSYDVSFLEYSEKCANINILIIMKYLNINGRIHDIRKIYKKTIQTISNIMKHPLSLSLHNNNIGDINVIDLIVQYMW